MAGIDKIYLTDWNEYSKFKSFLERHEMEFFKKHKYSLVCCLWDVEKCYFTGDAISKIIQPFRKTVENRTTLNITSNIESKPFTKRYYVIQAFKDCHWSDVLFSRGDIQTANKKSRHYRNQNNCETRVVEIRENVSYSYEYEVTNKYDRNKENG